MIIGDTIAAIATPIGTGGISIVKVSGPEAVPAVAALFRARNPQRRLAQQPSQRMLYGHICDPARKQVVDEVLVTVLRGPHSYTGEDVVEINCHGGIVVTETVMALLLANGLRLAEPGEFTRRAFLNGRLDLTQVEGTIDLIEAKTRRAARLGTRMLTQGLRRRVAGLQQSIVQLRAHVEAAIDFNEEDGTDLPLEGVRATIGRDLIPAVRKLLDRYREGRFLRHGLRIALAGKPNVGKSSLMNRLLRKDRVIVTEYPGTTRDTIEEGFEIAGLPVILCDTAGLREAADPVERIGQQKAQEAIETADLVLFMIDASQPTNHEDHTIALQLAGRPRLIVRNKIDLVARVAARAGGDYTASEGRVDISALTGEGLDALKDRLLRFAGMAGAPEKEDYLPNQRQKDLLQKALDVLTTAADPAGGGAGLELIAVDLKDGERYCNQLLGIDVEQDVLDTIFSRFCIGK